MRRPATYSFLSIIYRNLLSSSHEYSSSSMCNGDRGIEELHHEPVLVKEVIQKLQPKPGQTLLDLTFGAGGHTLALLHHQPDIKIFCLDRDPVAYERAKNFCDKYPQIIPLQGKFSQIHHLLHDHGYHEDSLDGILIDAGASSLQFDDPSAGFSISHDGPLDMRMDRGSCDEITAEDVVNNLDETGLYKILKKYGEEKRSRQISRAIVESRYAFGRIKTTSQLAKVIQSVFIEGTFGRDKLFRQAHVATRTFQALRIFVNNELNELHNGISIAQKLLKPGGVCVVISFHSLEDRIVKRHFHGIDMDARLNMSVMDQARMARTSRIMLNEQDMDQIMYKEWSPVFRGIHQASDEEVVENPRSRSAKLRAASKVLAENI